MLSLSKIKIFFSSKVFIKVSILIGLIFCITLSLMVVYFFEIRGVFKLIGSRYPQLKFVEKVPRVLDVFHCFYFLVPDELPKYELIINKKDLEILNTALPSKELVGDTYVILDGLEEENKKKIKANFIADGKKYKVKVSYRGDRSEHWENSKKSWRINFQDKLFNGKSSINLIIAEERNYILEEFNNYRAKKLGLFVPDSQMVNLRINGQRFGVYWEVEQWSKDMLERGGLRSDTNLYGENDLFLLDDNVHSIYSSINYWKKYSKNKFDKVDSYSDLNKLLTLLNNPNDDYFAAQIGSILDLNNFYHWQVHSSLINSLHQDRIHNARLYFDIEIGKFKFIPWDVWPFINARYGYQRKVIDFNHNELVTRILENDEFRRQRDLILWSYVKNKNNLKKDLEYYD